jgi:cytochrome c
VKGKVVRFLPALFSVPAMTLAASPSGAEEDPDVAWGKALIEANCARCHGTGLTDDSKHPEAPTFRTLPARYPLDALEEAFVEGISTGHPDMPEFVATPDQIAAIIAYIGSLVRE